MKALSARQAFNCETAEGGRCRCRCGGAAHGLKRAGDRAALTALPADDPHRIAPKKTRRRPVQDSLPLS